MDDPCKEYHPITADINSGVELYALRTKQTGSPVLVVSPTGAVSFGTPARKIPQEDPDDQEVFNAETFVIVRAPDPNNWTRRNRIFFLAFVFLDLAFALFFLGEWIFVREGTPFSGNDRFVWEAVIVHIGRLLRVTLGLLIVLKCKMGLLSPFSVLLLLDVVMDILFLRSYVQVVYYWVLFLLLYSAQVASSKMTPSYLASRSLFY